MAFYIYDKGTMRVRGDGCLGTIIGGILWCVFWCLEKLIGFIIKKMENKSELFIKNVNIVLIVIILCEIIFFIDLFTK